MITINTEFTDYDAAVLYERASRIGKTSSDYIHQLVIESFTKELTSEITYNFDAIEEITKILKAEIDEACKITEITLREKGWEEWHNPYTGKWTWVKHQQENIEISGLYGYMFEYDLESKVFRYDNGKFSSNKEFTGNIIDLENAVKMIYSVALYPKNGKTF